MINQIIPLNHLNPLIVSLYKKLRHPWFGSLKCLKSTNFYLFLPIQNQFIAFCPLFFLNWEGRLLFFLEAIFLKLGAVPYSEIVINLPRTLWKLPYWFCAYQDPSVQTNIHTSCYFIIRICCIVKTWLLIKCMIHKQNSIDCNKNIYSSVYSAGI